MHIVLWKTCIREVVMISNAKILFILALILMKITLLWAECNVCLSTTQMACVSETQYQACVNSLPSGPVNSCPSGYICSTATSVICQPSTSGFPASCGDCNVCDANFVFACTGTNSYALCLGTTVPSSTATGSCGTSLVCNTDLAQICGDPSTGIASTCPSVIDTTSTTAWTFTLPATPSLQALAQCLCQYTGINARFALPSELDRTCKNYIYCFRTTNGTWSGQFYTCAGSTYFDPNSRYCVATRPTGCYDVYVG